MLKLLFFIHIILSLSILFLSIKNLKKHKYSIRIKIYTILIALIFPEYPFIKSIILNVKDIYYILYIILKIKFKNYKTKYIDKNKTS